MYTGHAQWELSLSRGAGRWTSKLQGLGLETEKNSLTLIKVLVALFNLYVFKCLQDVHVNFMNPSVFVTQPSAKEKINFPSETETHRERLSSCPYLVGWTAVGAVGFVPQILDCLSLKGTNLSVNSVCPASIYYPSLPTLGPTSQGFCPYIGRNAENEYLADVTILPALV